MKKTMYEKHSDEELVTMTIDKDEDALRELLRRHRGFIIKKAVGYKKWAGLAHVRIDELITVGQSAIYESCKDFDPERGVKFLTFAGQVIRNKMFDFIKIHYKSRGHEESKSLRPINKSLPRLPSEEIEYMIELGLVEPQAVKKVFYEQFRECFLELPLHQQMILSYKFGYEPDEPVLSCEGRELPDEEVVDYFLSKMSLIIRDEREAYKQMRRGLFGDSKKMKKADTVREPGKLIHGDFWIVHERASV